MRWDEWVWRRGGVPSWATFVLGAVSTVFAWAAACETCLRRRKRRAQQR